MIEHLNEIVWLLAIISGMTDNCSENVASC
jgi:hypothetical protein